MRQTEIPIGRITWVSLLADLRVNDSIEEDIANRRRIASSISTNFHKPKLARFKVQKIDNHIIKITRTK